MLVGLGQCDLPSVICSSLHCRNTHLPLPIMDDSNDQSSLALYHFHESTNMSVQIFVLIINII